MREMKRTRPPWLDPTIVSASFLALASGFSQFAMTAALPDVAAAFGEPQPEIGVVRPGLAGTTLGLGLALVRLASLGALPLGSLADRLGRRRVLIGCTAIGLAITAGASTAPGFWWLVTILAFARPLLSATNAVSAVIAAEETTSRDRSKAIALIGGAYGLGSGVVAMVRGVADDVLGWRGLFGLSLIPLLLVVFLARRITEPKRYSSLKRPVEARLPMLGSVYPTFRKRLVAVAMVTAMSGLMTGPANTFLFYYGEGVVGFTPGGMGLLVFFAGPSGLTGLLMGRWAADRFGRRPAAAAALVGLAGAGWLTYTGTAAGLTAGYLGGILMGGAYGTAAGAHNAELFPTSIRSTVAGWVTAANVAGAVTGLFLFGALVDIFEGFGPAALSIAIPVAISAAVYVVLPESRGRELEDSAPEPEFP